MRVLLHTLANQSRRGVAFFGQFRRLLFQLRSIGNFSQGNPAIFNNLGFIADALIKDSQKSRFDFRFREMRRMTSGSRDGSLSVPAVADPDGALVFVRGVPDFAAIQPTTFTAYDSAGKGIYGAVFCGQLLPSLDFKLHQVKDLRRHDRLMAALHIILWDFALVDLLLFREKIDCEFLL